MACSEAMHFRRGVTWIPRSPPQNMQPNSRRNWVLPARLAELGSPLVIAMRQLEQLKRAYELAAPGFGLRVASDSRTAGSR